MYQLIAALVMVALGFGSGWQVRGWKAASDHSAQVQTDARDALRRTEHVDVAADAHEQFKQTAAARERVVIKEVDRVVKEPVYLNSCFSDDGLQLIAADIAARNPASKPTPAVPGTAKP